MSEAFMSGPEGERRERPVREVEVEIVQRDRSNMARADIKREVEALLRGGMGYISRHLRITGEGRSRPTGR